MQTFLLRWIFLTAAKAERACSGWKLKGVKRYLLRSLLLCGSENKLTELQAQGTLNSGILAPGLVGIQTAAAAPTSSCSSCSRPRRQADGSISELSQREQRQLPPDSGPQGHQHSRLQPERPLHSIHPTCAILPFKSFSDPSRPQDED